MALSSFIYFWSDENMYNDEFSLLLDLISDWFLILSAYLFLHEIVFLFDPLDPDEAILIGFIKVGYLLVEETSFQIIIHPRI